MLNVRLCSGANFTQIRDYLYRQRKSPLSVLC